MSGEAPLDERFAIEVLERDHERAQFRCGVDALDRYLREQASQDMRRNVATVLVAVQTTRVVDGYYTLSTAAVLLDALPEALRKKVPRYPTVPAVRLGRLAVSTGCRGIGLGEHLLLDAMARSLRSELAWAALLVDAKSDSARAFYARYGFESLLDDPLRLFVARGTIEPLFRDSAARRQRP